jgi:predicted Zn-dependent protease
MTDLLQPDSELINTLTATCAERLQQSETQRALVQALPRLDSSAMMLGAIQLMHRSTRRDLERSQQLLEALVDRHKRSVAPWAWLAKWHIMQVMQGMAPLPKETFQQAIDISDRALDLAPNSTLALSVKGHAMCHLGKNVDDSYSLLVEATQTDPNDPIAWLYRSVWSQMWGQAEDALSEAQNALQLSPLDPQRYYFEMMMAHSYLAAGNYDRCIEMCKSSLRRNQSHAPTLRALTIARFESGLITEAGESLAQLMALQPGFTVAGYLGAGPTSRTKQRGAAAFRALGVPSN